MATLFVHEILDVLYQQAQKIARAQGRSLSAYVLTMLEQAVEEEKLRRTRSKILARILHRRRTLPSNAPDSVKMLRQIRNENR